LTVTLSFSAPAPSFSSTTLSTARCGIASSRSGFFSAAVTNSHTRYEFIEIACSKNFVTLESTYYFEILIFAFAKLDRLLQRG